MRQTFARRSILGYCIAGASAALVAFTSRARAATTTFKADMKPSSEVPPNMTAGSGSATVTLDGEQDHLERHVFRLERPSHGRAYSWPGACRQECGRRDLAVDQG